MSDKRTALGRGLSALIPDAAEAPARPAPHELDIDLLVPNPRQPRQHVDDERLQELVQSIRASGIIQPIVVRRAGDRYEIVAGERRWRAAQLAGLLRVPVAVREVPDHKLLEIALVENIQREDLNPIEEGWAYRRLTEELSLRQEDVAAVVGKDRATVANHLRLLRLPAEVQGEVAGGALSMGHARALLSLTDEAAQRRLAREIIARGLSVRETESIVRRQVEGGPAAPARQQAEAARDVHVRAAEDRLKFALGTRVRIVRRGKGGRIEILFGDENELQRLFEQLTGE